MIMPLPCSGYLLYKPCTQQLSCENNVAQLLLSHINSKPTNPTVPNSLYAVKAPAHLMKLLPPNYLLESTRAKVRPHLVQPRSDYTPR